MAEPIFLGISTNAKFLCLIMNPKNARPHHTVYGDLLNGPLGQSLRQPRRYYHDYVLCPLLETRHYYCC